MSGWLLHFCQWAGSSFWGEAVRNSAWLFPFVEIFHLLALGTLGGTVLIVNLRLLGLGFSAESAEELARDVEPWMLGSLGVILLSGFFLFSSESVKMYGNTAFRVKMIFLLLALVFTFTAHRYVVRSREEQVSPLLRRLAAVLSLALWAGVGVAGRAIGIV